jgi:hypothetical protein
MWSDRQLSVLKQMEADGASTPEIALAVDKGVGAVRRKLRELGLNKPPGVQRKITDAEALDAYVRIKVNRRLSMSEACVTLGVSMKTLRRELQHVSDRYGNNPKLIIEAALKKVDG